MRRQEAGARCQLHGKKPSAAGRAGKEARDIKFMAYVIYGIERYFLVTKENTLTESCVYNQYVFYTGIFAL